MIRRSPLSIFIVALVLVYWCASVILWPFPYWVAKVVPVAVEAADDGVGMMEGGTCCNCGMGKNCTMPCCCGKNGKMQKSHHFQARGKASRADADGRSSERELRARMYSGAGCSCAMGKSPVDIPIEYVPVYGKHYYYPVQFGMFMSGFDGSRWECVTGDHQLKSLYEASPSSPPPKRMI